jgi:hypothetical protein
MFVTQTECIRVPSDLPRNEIIPSCEWVFPAKSDALDYHKTMDSDMFFGWVQHRLLPTIAGKYPQKKAYLVLDNAKYHKQKCDEYIDVPKLRREEIIDTMVLLGMQSIEFRRDGEPKEVLVETLRCVTQGLNFHA